MARRRGFREVAGSTPWAEVAYQARSLRDAGRHPLLAHAGHEDGRRGVVGDRARTLMDRDRRSPPSERKAAEALRKREASYNTVATFGRHYVKERSLRPNTLHSYERLLATRINPYLGETPLKSVTLSEIKAWRASLDRDRSLAERIGETYQAWAQTRQP